MTADLASQPPSLREGMFAVSAGFLGWTLDAFDFFLVVIALPPSPRTLAFRRPPSPSR